VGPAAYTANHPQPLSSGLNAPYYTDLIAVDSRPTCSRIVPPPPGCTSPKPCVHPAPPSFCFNVVYYSIVCLFSRERGSSIVYPIFIPRKRCLDSYPESPWHVLSTFYTSLLITGQPITNPLHYALGSLGLVPKAIRRTLVLFRVMDIRMIAPRVSQEPA